MAIVASSSSPAVVVADGSCDHDYSSSATLSTFDESEDASSARQHLDGLSNEFASIVGLCHPLLDLVATIDDFETYGLEPATQRLAKGSDEDKKLFARMLGDGELTVHRIAGGQAMNSLRGVKWWFDRHETDPEYNDVSFANTSVRIVGSVGDDEYGNVLREACAEAGLETDFEVFPGGRTGKCCALLKDKKRTMITDLGVAPDFRAGPDRGIPTDCRILYTTAFYACGDGYACREYIPNHPQIKSGYTKLFAGLSAAWACKNDDFTYMAKHACDVVFGNEVEFTAFAEHLGIAGISKMSPREIAEAVSAFMKPGAWAIMTQGPDPVICCSNLTDTCDAFAHTVRDLDPLAISDDIGAGDGFVGGFIAAIYARLLARDLTPRSVPSPVESSLSSLSDDDSSEVLPDDGSRSNAWHSITRQMIMDGVEEGIYCARQVMKHTGCQYF
ncbi:hypothetical protein FOL46_006086 [Perkinsus olseni]|uniref:adenosine kinase n=2 Tax=Perkinsus olseni TaxID=32597 RepID=A0A7J6LN88_PEROL|nr:hypothetical protein FOL46_006086 [Perkinsus olseni]